LRPGLTPDTNFRVPTARRSRRRIIVIGIDGAAPSIFFSLLDAGRLPFFARLATARGTTRSVRPIVSPAAWGTVMTGRRPGRHRMFSFQREVGANEVRIAFGRELGAGSLWRFLGERDRRCVVVNVPMTYPPEDVPGVIVSGVDTPSIQSDFIHPAFLRESFLARIPDYAIDLRSFGGQFRAEHRRALARDASKVMTARAAAFRWLLDTQEWDLGFAVFTEMDRIQHRMWLDHDLEHPQHEGDELRSSLADGYVQLDRLAEEIVTPWLDQDPLVVVMSDHGAGPLTRKFSVASVLREAGLLHLTAGATFHRDLIERTVAFLRRRPAWLKDLARRLAPGMRRRGYAAMLTQGIDWTRTVAYPAEFGGGIRLRRDLTGAERERASAAVHECLRSVTDPQTGGALIGHVWDREELWRGPYGSDAPDLFFECADPTMCVEFGLSNATGTPVRPIELSDQSGGHRAEGIFLAYGPGIRSQGDVTIGLEEIFPLLAGYLCGRYPDDLDGRFRNDVLDAVATPEPWSAEVQAANGLDDADDAQVRERLEGLGYL
jgi:predicted AlkP superfamily phosphohydrolase/phosphomutase